MKKYIEGIQNAMLYISKKKNAIFLGQSVKYPGSSIYESLKKVPDNKKIELHELRGLLQNNDYMATRTNER